MISPTMHQVETSSFRDPSGFLFWKNDKLYRQVNHSYREHYELLMSSGLYEKLIAKRMLVPHEECNDDSLLTHSSAYKVIAPEKLPFISYPYEWCFSQLKDAALLTLKIQKLAMEHGMTLKDASAYNVQFSMGRPIFIDTLSFEAYEEGSPWVAYKQFCQHFLAPLSLMSYVDVRLEQLLRVYIDGVPLDLTSRLLPFSTKFRFSLLSHIHLHAGSQKRHANTPSDGAVTKKYKMSKMAILGLFDSLENAVKRLTWKGTDTEWGDYYNNTNYNQAATQNKHECVKAYLEEIEPKQVWDLGANDGTYSRLALEFGADVVSWDIDPIAVEKNYLRLAKEKPCSMLPLLQDLTNPSPAQGWDHEERMSLSERAPVDLVMGLALIHHLAISNNVPLPRVAKLFAQTGRHAIIEFVPKEDSQVQKLLATREDIFEHYHLSGFEEAIKPFFEIVKKKSIQETKRTLYLLKSKNFS